MSGSHGSGIHRFLFGAVLAFWLLTPILVRGATAQDGPAFTAAARLVDDDPGAVYALRTGPRPDQLAPPR